MKPGSPELLLDTRSKHAILADGDEMMMPEMVPEMIVVYFSGSVADTNRNDNQRNPRNRGRPMVYLV